jgi:hypothetical protein
MQGRDKQTPIKSQARLWSTQSLANSRKSICGPITSGCDDSKLRQGLDGIHICDLIMFILFVLLIDAMPMSADVADVR